MLPASAPLLATPQASQFYSLLKEEEEEEECVCVCVCGRWKGAHLANRPFSFPPSVSQKAHLDFQLSDLLVSLSDIGAVKLSAGLHFMTCAMIILLPFTRSEEGDALLSVIPLRPSLPPLPVPLLYLYWKFFYFFFIWLENLLSPRGAVIIPSSTGITRQGDVDGCLLPSAGELSPRTTPTMTRSLWHALLQLPSLDTSLLPPLPARGPPPGRMLGYAAVIHLLQLALENVSHTHTLALAHTHIHTPRG